MKLFIGLGNPGSRFDGTRHNIGFEVIDTLSDSLNIPLQQTKFKGLYGTGNVNGEKVFLLKPLTYMNLSGECIGPFMDYFQIPLEDMIVVYDDLDTIPGKLRLRTKGSAGGHNGIKSMIAHLGTQEFKRIRFGIGRPTNQQPVPDFVLNRFSKEESVDIEHGIDRSVKACEAFIETTFDKVMNKFNG
ncbi:aminoacyl-tRNA hydrolase [Fictibacillus phosphorivorans]|uniref:Peptidyl-tRNA hydrolase n=1 Tax=Fictibacillus phosphorivorans TaxID=1221500 RepID=A0A168VPF9_9BACL|nr:aminoacyl-tRNA hydrolase [Fictibacillus phosphorivorans]ANC75389.1 aminoacyl-tRNA hydrolase [Fictibacillus phosphorivorans]MQR93956.1 aminoacyl-tRNA hydrolase [Fictibacillus phosphorivorans]